MRFKYVIVFIIHSMLVIQQRYEILNFLVFFVYLLYT